jgi:TM2 domain-containing membrane protein YozV
VPAIASHRSDRETLRLKMAGLAIIALGAACFAAVGNAVGDGSVFLSDKPAEVVQIAGAWLAGALIIAIGFIVLLAGLKNVRLLSSATARRGALRKLTGFSLIILCVAYVSLMDLPAFKFVDDEWWILLPSLGAFLVAARLGFKLLRTGWKYDAVPAEDVLANDPRPPVVYLRSFEADNEILLRPKGFWNRAALVCFDYMATFSPEQELAEFLQHVGPVIAIGRPGEALPELGAARLYVSDDDWKAKVADMMTRSRLLIIRTGDTRNLRWEIEEAMARVPRRQILFVSLGDAKTTAPFDQYFQQRFGPLVRAGKPTTTTALTKLLSAGKYATGKIIFFDEALQPRQEPIRLTLSWTGLALGLMRPYRDSIQSALQRVFSALALPTPARKSQTTVVLLAMVGGIFGLQYFYLGDRRRGLKNLGFFWTSIPVIVGWFDAVKFARLDSQEFDAIYGGRAVARQSGDERCAARI